MKFGWSEQTCFSQVHGWGPHHPCMPLYNFNSVPKWTIGYSANWYPFHLLHTCIRYTGYCWSCIHNKTSTSCSVAFNRTLKVRLSEHRQVVRRGDPKNSIVVHVQKTNHRINWEGATVQRRVKGFWLRRTVESIQIRKATPNMNLDSGLLLPLVWNPILKPPSPTPLSPILFS